MTADNMRYLGSVLRSLRGDITLEELSARSGVPLTTLSRIELGQTARPSFSDVVKIGKELGISPDEIAAVLDLWTIDESEKDQLPVNARRAVRDLRNYLTGLGRNDQEALASLVSTMISVHRQQSRQAGAQTAEEVLPDWLRDRRKASLLRTASPDEGVPEEI